MSIAIPKLRVGHTVRHEAPAVFPLFAEANGQVEYRLSDEALADEQILVKEVSEGGSAPDLLVENKGDVRLCFGACLERSRHSRQRDDGGMISSDVQLSIEPPPGDSWRAFWMAIFSPVQAQRTLAPKTSTFHRFFGDS